MGEAVLDSMNEFEVTVDGLTQYGGGFYLFNTSSSRLDEIGSKMAGMFGQVAGFFAQNNIQMDGMPFTIYEQIDEANNNAIFSAAIPVSSRVITPAGSPVLCGFMEPVMTVKTTLRGKYDYLDKAYLAAQQYLAENNMTADPTKKMFEIYANDPGDFPNPADWVTEVYIPVVVQNSFTE